MTCVSPHISELEDEMTGLIDHNITSLRSVHVVLYVPIENRSVFM